MGRAATPGLPFDRAGTLASAALSQAALLFGLAAMAGYAVEAAGLQFVGASLQTPPAGLLEASRQGLAEFCGTRPDSVDALRSACGLTPRATGVLDIARIRLAEPFLWTGAPVAFGAPSALAAPARLGPVAFPLLGLAGGLWLVALGLGRSVLGRGRIAPGLASHGWRWCGWRRSSGRRASPRRRCIGRAQRPAGPRPPFWPDWRSASTRSSAAPARLAPDAVSAPRPRAAAPRRAPRPRAHRPRCRARTRRPSARKPMAATARRPRRARRS